MTPSNATIADILRRYAVVLSLEGTDRFRLKAYRRAAETVESLREDVTDLVKRGRDLTDLPGIGRAISDMIQEIVRSGKLSRLEHKTAELSPELVELATRPALDPKKVVRVYKTLGIHTLRELKQHLERGSIGKELGSRIEYHVRQGLDDRPRSLLYDVCEIAESIESHLRSMPGVTTVSAAGSLRRKQETVGDLNFLFTGRSAEAVFQRFARFGAVLSSEKRGRAERAFKLSSGLTVTLRWTPPREWGWSLILTTGSVLHVEKLAARASRKKVAFTAKGLSRKHIDIADERTIYAGLGLAFVEPELREGRGEVAAAARARLPKLIEIADVRGDLHMHTTASDGANTIAEMAAAGAERGYEYIAITDHSQSLRIANGLSEKRLLEHVRAIDKVNAKLKGLRVLKSAEVDILHDGTLDYSASVLKELDFTICSIHSRFGLNKEQQTERILRAMDSRYFTILGHATGRSLLKRPGYELNMERIIEHAKARGCFFEINSSPDRLDLSDEHAKRAKEQGIKIAVNTDAHSIDELDFISVGIDQARRAWLQPGDVLNALSLKQLLGAFRG